MSLYRPKTSTRWWYRFKINGKEFRGSTGTRSRHEAEVIERRKRSELEGRNPKRRKSTGHTLAELAGLDIERAIAEGVDEDTRVPTLTHMWSWLIRELGDCNVERIDARQVTTYITARRHRRVSGQTIRRELQCLKRGLTLAYRRGWVGAKPDTDDWPRLRSAPKGRSAGKSHEPEVVRRWLAGLRQNARDEALLVALTGLRSAEVKRICVAWVRPAPPGMGVPALLEVPAAGAKTRKPRVIGLPAPAVEILERRAVARDVPVLPQSDFKKHRAAVARRIGYSATITLRDLRHCHLTWGLEVTGDARATLEAAGHTDLRTTERYLHTTLTRTAGVAHAVAGVLDDESTAA